MSDGALGVAFLMTLMVGMLIHSKIPSKPIQRKTIATKKELTAAQKEEIDADSYEGKIYYDKKADLKHKVYCVSRKDFSKYYDGSVACRSTKCNYIASMHLVPFRTNGKCHYQKLRKKYHLENG